MAADADIVRVLRGDRDAYAGVVREHQAALRIYIARYCPGPGLIDDVAQRTFVWAYEHLNEYRIGTRFEAWLKSIARNILLAEMEAIRREAANRRAYLEHLQATRATAALVTPDDTEALAEALRACVAELPEASGALVRERYSDRRPVEEIARVRGTTAAAIKMALLRVRQALRRCVEGKRGAFLEIPREARA